MGQVDLDFMPDVPVFDANINLGRRHDKRVEIDDAEGTIAAMRQVGISRALVYSAHAAYWDPEEGNQILIDTVDNYPSLIPQFIASPYDDLDRFIKTAQHNDIRSVRMLPSLYNYAFRDWAIKPWLDWFSSEKIPIWLPVEYTTHVEKNFGRKRAIDPTQVYDTLTSHPDLNVVLCDLGDQDFPWAFLLLKSVSNLYLELSGYVAPNGISMAIESIGAERILFGSRFPDAAMSPQLYNLHRCGLSEAALKAICSENLERILGMR